jgi:hypothetical protein
MIRPMSRYDAATELGTMAAWDEAPVGADLVRARYNGQVFDEPIVERAYLAVWWRQPEPTLLWPRISFRIGGT